MMTELMHDLGFEFYATIRHLDVYRSGSTLTFDLNTETTDERVGLVMSYLESEGFLLGEEVSFLS